MPRLEGSKELELLSEKIITGALLLGLEHAGTKLALADEPKVKVHVENGLTELPFEEAVDYFKSQIPLSKNEWEELKKDGLFDKLKFRAFVVNKLTQADFVAMLQGRLIDVLEKGDTLGETWADVETMLESWGEKFSPGYFETVFRTNIQSAYNAGRLLQYKDNPPPAWQLLFIQDKRQSDTCKGLQAIVHDGAMPADHRFWKTYGFPPYHYNCRTTVRAVYDYSKDTPRVNPSMNSIRKAKFKPQSGFGGNPLEKESFWKLTKSMLDRVKRYGLKNDVEAFARKLGIENYDVRLVKPITTRKLTGTNYSATLVKGAEPLQKEINVARILEEKYGEKVLFTPKLEIINNTQGIKNPEGILVSRNKIFDIKEIESARFERIADKIEEANEQKAELVIIHLVGEKPYSIQKANEVAKDTLKDIRAKEKQGKGKSFIQEVWILKDEKLVSRIKR